MLSTLFISPESIRSTSAKLTLPRVIGGQFHLLKIMGWQKLRASQ